MNHISLDIEGTLINDLHDPIYIPDNITKIKKIIKNKSCSVNFFSFAIHSIEDVRRNEFILKDLVSELGLTWSEDLFVLKNDLFPLYKQKFGSNFTMEDFSDFSQDKEMGFNLYIKDLLKKNPKLEGNEFYLIDDKVDDVMTMYKTTNRKDVTVITFVDAKQLDSDL